MKYITLGKSDLRVSRICLGSMAFSNPTGDSAKWMTDQEKSVEIIHRALDAGINFFDTALVYNGDVSEQHIERVLKDYAKREELVGATKFTPGSCLLCNNMCRDTENKNFNGLKTNYCLPPFPTSTLEMFKASGIRQHQIAGQLESGCHG